MPPIKKNFKFWLPLVYAALFLFVLALRFADGYFNFGMNECNAGWLFCFGALDKLLIYVFFPWSFIFFGSDMSTASVVIIGAAGNLIILFIIGHLVDKLRQRKLKNLI